MTDADDSRACRRGAVLRQQLRTPEPGLGTEEVLVLDFGGQYSQLIARRIRECGVFSELLPATASVEAIRERAPKALVLSGGPASVYEPGAPRLPDRAARPRDPDAGHLLRDAGDGPGLGGKVEGAEAGEFGRAELTLRDGGGRLLGGLPEEQSCWMSHRDTVFEPPPGFDALASSPGSPVAAVRGARQGPLRDPVPPGGRPHALRHRDPHPLPARHRRLRAAVVAAVGDRRAGRADPGPGGGGHGDLRPLRRRRLLGRRRCSCTGRSARS